MWRYLWLFVILCGFSAPVWAVAVRGISVDASGANATEARTKAMAQAEQKGFSELMRQLLGANGGALPNPSAGEISAAVQGYEVANEKIAPNRYRAKVTVHYNPSFVKKYAGRTSLPAPAPAPAVASATETATSAPAQELGAEQLAAAATRPVPAPVVSSQPAVMPLQRLQLLTPIHGVSDWVGVRQRLAKVPMVQGMRVTAFALHQADAEVIYRGQPRQLQNAVAQAGLDLRYEEGYWVLRRRG